MTRSLASHEAEPRPSPTELKYASVHLPELRRAVLGQQILYVWLVIAFVVGLAVHICGYVLGGTTAGEPAGLIADLLTTLGTALWTGVVLVLLVEVLPHAQRRSALRLVQRYEDALREQAIAQSPDLPDVPRSNPLS